MITMKLVAQIWRRENENQNAEKIAEKAGQIYNQVRLIVESMNDAKKKLSSVESSFDKALERLQDGKGNLVERVEKIRLLGAKVKKRLPSTVAEEAIKGDTQDNGLQDVEVHGGPSAFLSDP
jgi:DNA recombination protein RmuC